MRFLLILWALSLGLGFVPAKSATLLYEIETGASWGQLSDPKSEIKTGTIPTAIVQFFDTRSLIAIIGVDRVAEIMFENPPATFSSRFPNITVTAQVSDLVGLSVFFVVVSDPRARFALPQQGNLLFEDRDAAAIPVWVRLAKS